MLVNSTMRKVMKSGMALVRIRKNVSRRSRKRGRNQGERNHHSILMKTTLKIRGLRMGMSTSMMRRSWKIRKGLLLG